MSDTMEGSDVPKAKKPRTPTKLKPHPFLSPLCDEDELRLSLDGILDNTCLYQRPYKWYWPAFPERPKILRSLPVRRVTKKGQLGKEKSTKGFIWTDVDPLAILANKYVVRSCHTLDNTQYLMRAGNFNYAYTPFMGCVFAGAKSPVYGRMAVSKISGSRPLQSVSGEPLMIREHQAVANVFLMRDVHQQPYLLLCRLYDSAVDNPWASSILRYMLAHAARMGVGLAVGTTWQDWRTGLHSSTDIYELLQKKAGKGRFQKPGRYHSDFGVALRTPAFPLPFRDPDGASCALAGYGVGDTGDDHILLLNDGEDGYLWNVYAYRILHPAETVSPEWTDGLREVDVRSRPNGFYGPDNETYFPELDDAFALRPFPESRQFVCFGCGLRYRADLGQMLSGNRYCPTCYDQLVQSCGDCQMPFDPHSGIQTEDGLLICPNCATRSGRWRECSCCVRYHRDSTSTIIRHCSPTRTPGVVETHNRYTCRHCVATMEAQGYLYHCDSCSGTFNWMFEGVFGGERCLVNSPHRANPDMFGDAPVLWDCPLCFKERNTAFDRLRELIYRKGARTTIIAPELSDMTSSGAQGQDVIYNANTSLLPAAVPVQVDDETATALVEAELGEWIAMIDEDDPANDWITLEEGGQNE